MNTSSLPWEDDEKSIATKYRHEKCGLLHLQWLVDRYFGLVTQEVILPTAHQVYDALVKRDHHENNKLYFHDDSAFFIPSKNKKVFVHTTQSRDFLYIISQNEFSEESFHIRRIYRDVKSNEYLVDELKNASLKTMLRHADNLIEYHDDNCEFSRRHSLEVYRKVDFQIPYNPPDHMTEVSFCGDFTDGGYILSYDRFLAQANGSVKISGSTYSFGELKNIATILLPCIARELELEVPELSGYELSP